MAKIVRHLRDGQMEFQKAFSKLCNTKSAWQAWSDFVEMTAISISNSFEIREKVKQEREERYLNIISQYSKSEQAVFPELLNILVQSLERNQEQDFLGEMFMALELGSHWKGQFFTPYNLCKAMAMLTVPSVPEKLKEKEWVGLNDPACGAGATLIGARNALADMNIGPSQAFFVGQDLDRTAGMMCYIQLSLLGCAGYVVIADTLCNPVTGPMLWPRLREDQDAWFMPMTFMEPTWALRLCRTWWRGLDTDEEPIYDETVTEEPICDETVTADPPAAENSHTDLHACKENVQECEAPAPEPTPEPVQNVSFMDTSSGQLSLF